jgi:hypothetical protein
VKRRRKKIRRRPFAARNWVKLLPVSVVYIHHDAGDAPGAKEPERAHREYTEHLNLVALGRGFNGYSYNYGVDKRGVAWQGRGEHVGAQNDGENSTSIGIVAYGNFEHDKATDEIVNGIGFVIARKKKNGVIKRFAFTIIRGHRDSDATACPGDHLYARVKNGDIRKAFRRHYKRMKAAA